ncbi:hypothetical protein BCR39DRAFT_598553 [Naematelia encephala]|uniref:Gylcosyl hydrolase 115 C-terminal domain-containing protein n=1 Tax=Naematelia encephala TaxID=71784 RepID=A0A1Y2B5B6_9TREE|nr:hypothetical protein BCR39DRAFT_598553 [Naematelia encephala]
MWSRLLLLVSLAASQVTALGEKRVLVFPDSSLDRQIATEDQTVFSALSSLSSHKRNTDDLSRSTDTDDLSSSIDTDDLFYLSSKSSDKATPLLLDSQDDIAIHLAAQTFAHDVYRVTGLQPDLYNDTLPSGIHNAVVVGSAGSKLIGGIHENEYVGQLELKGKWESYDVRVVERPLHGLNRGLVIVGSDRRGTIYALYTLSEQMGVSPFHYWADVPVRPKPSIAFTASQHLSHGEPSVKYRGLFINDEHPALWGWAEHKWKVKPGDPAFLPDMYRPWFEMMLRLKANYFWPAMYASMFDVDGMDTSNGFPMPAAPGPNQVLANEMGIVMGSSHHEPMARNKPEWDRGKQGPWDWTNSKFLTKWWTYGAERAKGMETLFTLGMRGDGDMPLTGASNKLVENITATQQNILKEVYETDDLSTVPQMWCMYKEVAEYYVNGSQLEVPEDVITLFADDNWGNIMTVQPPEKQHKAGSGIYYHVDYVGMPRAYKWINTINLAKTWEQMTIAHTFNTTSIWILNIGSLKPLELPAEHFLSLAWDIEAWPINSVETYLSQWAEREFGEEVKDEVAEIMMKYSMYASRRKAELVNSTTFSLVNYEEAERVLGAWQDLTERASKVHASLPDDTKPAFYEMVYGLCLMQTNLNKLYIAAERSNLYAEQARNAANLYAKEAVDAFFYDANLTETFHALLDRKWDHMLDQAHIGWNSHLEPMKDIMPPVSYVNPMIPARQGIPIPELSYGVTTSLRVTFENSRGSWPGNTVYNCPGGEHCTIPSLLRMDPYGSSSRWIDVGASGPRDTTFKVDSDDWIIVEPKSGKIARDGTTDMRLSVSIDWSHAPENTTTGYIHFTGSDRSNVTIAVPTVKFDEPPSDFHGTVEGDGYVVIEAAHFARNTSKHEYAFQEIKGYGRTLSGLEMFPRTTQNFTKGQGPSLEYDFYTYTTSDEAEIDIQIGPTLNFLGINKTLSFAIQIDGHDIEIINPIPTEPLGFAKERPDQTPVAIGAVPKDWIEIVKNEIRDVRIPISLDKNGKHTIKIFGMTTGIIIERVIVDLGGIKSRGYSYLGPPESVRV